ncbi:unnamed protein product [Dovyalis caffra]|uniref:Non-specific lipid-transfer protein n=1 Tax=Dovyalis caffra TaxID=77055 RepID=A0AAV1SF84_9ROSI|nr:unnamed protein product [Dovyalis caffra]
MKGAVISVLVVLAMVQFMVKPGEAVTCADVNSDLAPCVSFLTGKGGGVPTPLCCSGVSKLKDSAPTVADKRAACDCVKQAATRIPDIKEDAASSLPTKCNVQLDIPISKNFNCAE